MIITNEQGESLTMQADSLYGRWLNDDGSLANVVWGTVGYWMIRLWDGRWSKENPRTFPRTFFCDVLEVL